MKNECEDLFIELCDPYIAAVDTTQALMIDDFPKVKSGLSDTHNYLNDAIAKVEVGSPNYKKLQDARGAILHVEAQIVPEINRILGGQATSKDIMDPLPHGHRLLQTYSPYLASAQRTIREVLVDEICHCEHGEAIDIADKLGEEALAKILGPDDKGNGGTEREVLDLSKGSMISVPIEDSEELKRYVINPNPEMKKGISWMVEEMWPGGVTRGPFDSVVEAEGVEEDIARKMGWKVQKIIEPVVKPTRTEVTVESWHERDRVGIWVDDKRTGRTIVEWWDDDARQMIEDGFFKAPVALPSTLGGAAFIDSVLDYAESMGWLAKE